MLEGGEDPKFIARRMIVAASEDIGNADPRALEVAVAAAREAKAVAHAQGLELTVEPEVRLKEVCAATAANLSSMLQDVLAGRETEIAALNGEVAARGARLGVPTPVNSLLTRLVQALTLARPQQVN